MIFSDPNSDMSKKIEKPIVEKLSQILKQLEVAEKENPLDLAAQIHKIEGGLNRLLAKEISKLSQAATPPCHGNESSFVLDSM